MTAGVDDEVNSLEEDISVGENATDSPPELDDNDRRALENIKDQGVEGGCFGFSGKMFYKNISVIVAGFLKLICSLLLFLGVRSVI